MNTSPRNVVCQSNFTSTALLALVLLVGAVPAANAATLSIEIKGEVGDKGSVLVAIYKADDKWMGKGSDARKALAKKDGVSVTFSDLTEGEYAISMFVDENNNGKLDANAIGMPIEPYAFSNGAMGNFGPPTFAQAKFVVGKDNMTHVITLK